MSNPKQCDHKSAIPKFDPEVARGMDSCEVRAKFPRFFGNCPDCGEQVIAYASSEHYYSGDW